MDILMWVECLSYDYILQYCRLYQPGSIVICETVNIVIASCGKNDSFLAHLSIKVAKNNFYVISWAYVTVYL